MRGSVTLFRMAEPVAKRIARHWSSRIARRIAEESQSYIAQLAGIIVGDDRLLGWCTYVTFNQGEKNFEQQGAIDIKCVHHCIDHAPKRRLYCLVAGDIYQIPCGRESRYERQHVAVISRRE